MGNCSHTTAHRRDAAVWGPAD